MAQLKRAFSMAGCSNLSLINLRRRVPYAGSHSCAMNIFLVLIVKGEANHAEDHLDEVADFSVGNDFSA